MQLELGAGFFALAGTIAGGRITYLVSRQQDWGKGF